MDGLTPERVDALLDRARSARILVVGDLMLDRFLSGSIDRLSPEAPVPVVDIEAEHCSIGGAANVAANVVALGGHCAVLGVVGDDQEGHTVRNRLAERGVGVDGLLVDVTRPTTLKTRILARGRQVVRYDRESRVPVGPWIEAELCDSIARLAPDCDAIVVGDYDKGVMTGAVVVSCIEASLRSGIPCIVDPKRRNFFAYAGAAVFKPNLGELEAALASPCREGLSQRIESVRTRLGVQHLLVTLGARGMLLASVSESPVEIPAEARSVYDVSGAGDTVAATLGVVLAVKGSVLEAARLANHVAALEVSRSGVATISAQEVREDIGRSTTLKG